MWTDKNCQYGILRILDNDDISLYSLGMGSNESTRFKKGNPGKPKGAKDLKPRVTATLKSMVMDALHAKGGTQWFEDQMDENPNAVLNFLGKYVPQEIKSEISGPGGEPLQILTSVPETDLNRPPSVKEVDTIGTYEIEEGQF